MIDILACERMEGRDRDRYLEQQQTKKIETALIKKKIKFSSYIRKFRMEQLQSHI